jgi:hypothetical protein
MDKKDLIAWLLESERLLKDKLDWERLNGLSLAELYRFCQERQAVLRESAAKDSHEADCLKAWGRARNN